jgi:cell division protein FtsB
MKGRGKALGVAALTAAGCLLLSMADARGFRRYFRLRQEMSELKERNKRLSDQNQTLVREIQALRGDPEALERAAREELGFVKPGEVVLNLE